jgi:hypothetical protein
MLVATRGNRITKVVDTNTEVPNHPGLLFTGFGSIQIADDRTITFENRYNLNGIDFQGLYKKSSVGLEVLFDQFDGLVVNREHISLVDGGRLGAMFLAPRFANVVGNTAWVAFFKSFLRKEPLGGAAYS